MHWAPHFQQQLQEWRPEWTCLRCNTTLTPDHPLLQQLPEQPRCPQHGPRTLALDLPRHERGWVCTTGNNPPRIHTCVPAAITETAPPQHTTSNTLPPCRVHAASPQWLHQGPPQHRAPGPTNSWLYVPLLHAGAGRLQQATEQAWSQHPHSTHEWQALVQHLREAPPVPWQQLHNTLSVLQQVHVQNGGQLSTIEADLPHSSHPAAPGNRDPLPLGLEPHDGHQRIRSSNSTGSTAEHVPRRTGGGKSATSHNSTAERGHPQARPDPDPPCSTSQGQQLRGRGRDKSRRAQRGGQPQQFQHHNRLQLQHFSHFGFTATQCRHTSPRSSNYKSDGATEQPPAQSSTTQQQRSCNAESAAYLGPNQPP